MSGSHKRYDMQKWGKIGKMARKTSNYTRVRLKRYKGRKTSKGYIHGKIAVHRKFKKIGWRKIAEYNTEDEAVDRLVKEVAQMDIQDQKNRTLA